MLFVVAVFAVVLSVAQKRLWDAKSVATLEFVLVANLNAILLVGAVETVIVSVAHPVLWNALSILAGNFGLFAD